MSAMASIMGRSVAPCALLLCAIVASTTIACAPDVRLSPRGESTRSTTGTGGTAPTSPSTNTAGAGGTSPTTTSSSSTTTTTTTPLGPTNDPHNCGTVGHDCLGGACVDGACQPVVIDSVLWSTVEAVDLALNDTHLYWTHPKTGVYRAPLPSGPVELVAADFGATAVLLDESNVYWANSNNIVKKPLSGGAATVLYPCMVTCGPGRLALHGGFIYGAGGGSVRKGSVDGGEWASLPFFAMESHVPIAVVVDDTGVYWGDNKGMNPQAYRTPHTGDSATPLGPVNGPRFLKVDDTNVYWTNAEADAFTVLAKAPKAGGESTPLGAGAFGRGGGLALDATHVYWADAHFESVFRVAKTGGPAETVVSGYFEATSLAMNAKAIYWTYFDQSKMEVPVMMLAR